MEQPYIGEIRVFAFPLVPQGWAPCDGRALSKVTYSALAQVLGSAFGSTDTTFNLPDLRGRTPLGVKEQAFPMGKSGGKENVSLENCINPHTHALAAAEASAAIFYPSGNMLCAMPLTSIDQKQLYSKMEPSENARTLDEDCVSYAGGSVAHNNMQPSLVLNFCIALFGTYPQDDGKE